MSAPKVTPAGAGPVSTGFLEDGRMRAHVLEPPATIAPFGYLTPQDAFGDVERGSPLPYTLPPEQRQAVGLERDTWRLEVVADPASDARLEQPLSVAAGTALDFAGLLRLAETHGVQYLKGMTCNNLGEPLGMGLWEGVPLRVVIWLARPVANVRRVYYYGYHNDDPAQRFQSSLPLGRVLEDPPGELPVLLCYKLNGEFLTGKRGGPVRMVVPEAYGFKSVKWLQRVVLTNDYRANDTYHSGNNDLESPMKTFARFVSVPTPATAGAPITITGLAQVGVSGLAKVQVWLHPAGAPLPADDPLFERGAWHDADLLPPPDRWGSDAPDGRLPGTPLLFDPATGAPRQWPLRYTIAHWTAVLRDVPPGRYDLRCRSIDLNGNAQPMPRPYAKSGRAEIQRAALVVEA
ncbi:MAG: molybdopterin-dependent oxidoreductase [Chloroflexi bacterium]|nr:molybdopterin-dependent oxidoreductase [Chloroflexota bacterium]